MLARRAPSHHYFKKEMMQINRTELISSTELTFVSCLTGVTNVKSKKISVQAVIQAIILLTKGETKIYKRVSKHLQHGQINSLVHQRAWKSREENWSGWLQDYFLGEEKPFHSISRSQEYSGEDELGLMKDDKRLKINLYWSDGREKVWIRKRNSSWPKTHHSECQTCFRHFMTCVWMTTNETVFHCWWWCGCW